MTAIIGLHSDPGASIFCTFCALVVAGFFVWCALPSGWFDQFARPDLHGMRRANRWREVLRRNGGGR